MLSPEDVQRISSYVSSTTDPVFALSKLPEEVIAVLFAYYSRSKKGLRENLAQLLLDQEIGIVEDASAKVAGSFGMASARAQAFHEKWTVGYGHRSVAEHAIVHLGIEDVSILASKVIEDMRLGSFTEKSTRYVAWARDTFVIPEEIKESRMLHRYESACQKLFDTYIELIPHVEREVARRSPRPKGKSEAEHAATVRARTLDVVRGLLPASAKTSLGLTANARALESHLCKMLGSPLAEVRHLGGDMQNAALTVVPTMLRHVAPAPPKYSADARDALYDDVRRIFGSVNEFVNTFAASPAITLHHVDMSAALLIASALVFEQSEAPWSISSATRAVKETRSAERICREVLLARMPHENAPRAFEAARAAFGLEMDFGAYRDLQRHRMLMPATQQLGCAIGYDVPELILELGLGDKYRCAIDAASDVWYALVDECGPSAQYVVPLAFKIRTLWHLSLRELIHIVELRTGPQGHASYRSVAQAIYNVTRSVLPWLDGALRVDLNDYALAR
jgi:thymidylate synthase ThyX